MPRYYFHIMDSRALIDTEGVELPDIDAARKMAVRTAGAVIVSEGDKFWNDGKWRMTVVDENRDVRFTLDVTAFTHD